MNREQLQKRVFTRWVQLYLRETEYAKAELDLNTDLKDGRIIAQLISVLANKPLSFKLKPSENKLQCVGNLQQALAFIADQGIRLSVGPEDIYDGKTKLILGLIWSLMLKYQIQNRKQILEWTQEVLNGLTESLRIENLDSSWSNGVGFCYLVNRFVPDIIPVESINANDPVSNMQTAFVVAEKELGIPPLLEAGDHQLMGEREVLTYLSFFYHIRARLESPPPPAAPKAPERDELGELRALLAVKEAEIARFTELCNQQADEIAALKHELHVSTECIRIRDAEVVSLSEKNAQLDQASQDLIRQSQERLDELIESNAILKQDLERVQAENTEINRRVLQLTLKLPLYAVSGGSSVPPPEGKVTLVFTDVQSSTEQWESTPEAMAESLAMHNTVMREAIEHYHGYEVKTEGDAFMVAFSEAKEAAQWCLDVQKRLLDVEWPDGIFKNNASKEERTEEGALLYRGLRVRMGVHTGEPKAQVDPTTKRMDYFGPMVNRSARVEGAAFGGQIIVSGETMADITEALEELGNPTVKDLGSFMLKGLTTETQLVQLLPADLPRVFPEMKPLSAAEEKKAAINEDVNKLKAENDSLQEKLREMEQRALDDDRKAHEMMAWLDEMKSQFGSNEFGEFKDKLRAMLNQQKEIAKQLEGSQQRNEDMSRSISVLSRALEKSTFREDELDLQLSDLKSQNEELYEEVKALFEELQRASHKKVSIISRVLGRKKHEDPMPNQQVIERSSRRLSIRPDQATAIHRRATDDSSIAASGSSASSSSSHRRSVIGLMPAGDDKKSDKPDKPDKPEKSEKSEKRQSQLFKNFRLSKKKLKDDAVSKADAQAKEAAAHATVAADHATEHATAAADHATVAADHATEHATAAADHATVAADHATEHATAAADHATAAADHATAAADHATEHATAAADHATVAADHATEHATAAADHAKATADHATEHATAAADHATAAADHATEHAAAADHATEHASAAADHATEHAAAAAEHATAAADHATEHATAAADHASAAADHPTEHAAAADHATEHATAADHASDAVDHAKAASEHASAAVAEHTTPAADHVVAATASEQQ